MYVVVVTMTMVLYPSRSPVGCSVTSHWRWAGLLVSGSHEAWSTMILTQVSEMKSCCSCNGHRRLVVVVIEVVLEKTGVVKNNQ
jgi:hypothetical protein